MLTHVKSLSRQKILPYSAAYYVPQWPGNMALMAAQYGHMQILKLSSYRGAQKAFLHIRWHKMQLSEM
jgi:hypothetical protein